MTRFTVIPIAKESVIADTISAIVGGVWITGAAPAIYQVIPSHTNTLFPIPLLIFLASLAFVINKILSINCTLASKFLLVPLCPRRTCWIEFAPSIFKVCARVTFADDSFVCLNRRGMLETFPRNTFFVNSIKEISFNAYTFF